MSEITHSIDGFTYRAQIRGDVAHVALGGELDFDASRIVESAFAELVAEDARMVVLDLADLSFIDSTGLAVLVRAKRHVESRSSRLFIRRHSSASQRLIDLAGLTTWLAPVDALGVELVPCPVCDHDISPLTQTCEHCGSAL